VFFAAYVPQTEEPVYPSVATAFEQINNQLEGKVSWPYLDSKGLVTCAVGYLVDDGSGVAPSRMLALPWKHTDGTTATDDEIRTGWLAVKNSGLAGIGGGNQKFADLTDLRLDEAGIDQATKGWIADAEPILTESFPDYPTMQADAQLALLLMAYALGPAFSLEYPKFTAAINATIPEYDVAAQESHISTVGNPGVEPRDQDLLVLLGNAERAQATNVPHSVLWYPNTTPPGYLGTGFLGGIAGKVLMGGVAALFGYMGWQTWIHRNDVSPPARKLLL
jgi:hypothetical protein